MLPPLFEASSSSRGITQCPTTPFSLVSQSDTPTTQCEVLGPQTETLVVKLQSSLYTYSPGQVQPCAQGTLSENAEVPRSTPLKGSIRVRLRAVPLTRTSVGPVTGIRSQRATLNWEIHPSPSLPCIPHNRTSYNDVVPV